MAKLLVLSLTVLFCVVLGLVKGDSVEDAKEAISEVGTTKEGAKYCPAPLLGTRCPDSSIFHYYECCGTVMKDCCFNLQVWVIVVLAVIAVIVIAAFVLSILRCLFCRRS